ncbi:MAG: alpha-glucan family phosphorylase [Planctomycetes bacterium]|nr:alpha-glucan family phosphorylase [Planctomycetota bacterium]
MATRNFRTFTVLPNLPSELQGLQELTYNLWWCWNHDAISLFRRIDEKLFEKAEHSPVRLLATVGQDRLEQLRDDEGFMAHLTRVLETQHRYLTATTWFHDTFIKKSDDPEASIRQNRIAYFSAEFGLHESVPIYSGGLGLLAGDHLKSASDLGLPLVGVGLMYREGYFRQYLNVDGWQQERYPENDFFNLPLISQANHDGTPLIVTVPLPGRDVAIRVWKIDVGRIPLYLLDTNIPQNTADDRQITSRLYGGDHDMRIRQEMVLGIGGVRALRALGKAPTVCHMNEGHSAFCGLERIRVMMEEYHLDFAGAREAVSAGTCFTTHTPVPAGNDVFAPQLIQHYFAGYLPQLRIDWNEFLGLGRQNPRDFNEPFCMTVLALRLSNISNGVSALHGKVSRSMWKSIWPNLPESEIPITSITNGVHTRSWMAADFLALYDRYLGTQWDQKPADHTVWRKVDNIPNAELWRTHERRRERLVVYARGRLRVQLERRGATPAEIPVQLISAGKAPPRDHGGKELIAEIVHVCRRPELRRRMVFLEDYDINVARVMVQGVDIWLNNPRRPLEASGTSGMKACINGGLNLSILDGWWCEGYSGDNGWAIGAGEEYSDNDRTYQDDIESRAIYDLLEQEIVPMFYNRSSDGTPRGWINYMKQSIKTCCPVFNTHRQVEDYAKRCYVPSAFRYAQLTADNLKSAADLSAWRRKLQREWGQVRVENVDADGRDAMRVGAEFEVEARIVLGNLAPDDVEVQLFHGIIDNAGEIPQPSTVVMSTNGAAQGSTWLFTGKIRCQSSGHYGYTVRVLPRHVHLGNPFEPGLVCWG